MFKVTWQEHQTMHLPVAFLSEVFIKYVCYMNNVSVNAFIFGKYVQFEVACMKCNILVCCICNVIFLRHEC